MHKPKVFITGATGFLGSAILAKLVAENYEVLALRRSSSNLERCLAVYDRVQWVDADTRPDLQPVVDFCPAVIIHAAWNGVSAKDRADWDQQLKNFPLLHSLVQIARQVKVEKFIILGSQAEYGITTVKVDETTPANGTEAYATCKLAMKTIVESFCNQNKIDWYWLRVFSVYGPGEDESWFIPWIINNQLNGTDSNLTPCEQQYDYLFIDQFAAMIEKITATPDAASGIYNICSGTSVTLRKIAEQVKEATGGTANLNFGAAPYRMNQSMYIGGDNSKFRGTFGEVLPGLTLQEGIRRTVHYYKERYIKKGS